MDLTPYVVIVSGILTITTIGFIIRLEYYSWKAAKLENENAKIRYWLPALITGFLGYSSVTRTYSYFVDNDQSKGTVFMMFVLYTIATLIFYKMSQKFKNMYEEKLSKKEE